MYSRVWTDLLMNFRDRTPGDVFSTLPNECCSPSRAPRVVLAEAGVFSTRNQKFFVSFLVLVFRCVDVCGGWNGLGVIYK